MPAESSNAARVVGRRIQESRLKLGASQQDLANLAGMNVANFGKIERGVGNPTLESLVRISASLGIDPAELVRGLGGNDLPPAKRAYSVADFLTEKQRREG